MLSASRSQSVIYISTAAMQRSVFQLLSQPTVSSSSRSCPCRSAQLARVTAARHALFPNIRLPTRTHCGITQRCALSGRMVYYRCHALLFHTVGRVNDVRGHRMPVANQ